MGKEIDRLIRIIEKLRGPEGCPWDKEQNHKTILSCFLDEIYEFFDAVEENDHFLMKEELGDILLQVIFHSQIAKEDKKFDIEEVVLEICEKLIRRHPHVFGTEKVNSSQEVLQNWEEIKKGEKGKEKRKYIVDDIPETLPALFRAEKIQRRVARVGFDWQEINPAIEKVEEEFKEFKDAIFKNNFKHAFEEMGDILFALVNVARHSQICAEDALRLTIKKFEKRFRYIEDEFKKSDKSLKKASLEELDIYWEKSKKIVG